MALLQLHGVHRRFRMGPAVTIEVLRGISLVINSGDSLAIVGPSGCGKTTLLHLLGALDKPDAGSILFQGRDLSSFSEKEAAEYRNRTVGFIFQNHHLLPSCSLIENVMIPALIQDKAARAFALERAMRLLARVGLANRINHKPGMVSGGECQRTALVRALVNRPALLLADEPTGSLDRQSASTLADLMAELQREEQMTLIVATHSASIAARMAKRLELIDGLLVEGNGTAWSHS